MNGNTPDEKLGIISAIARRQFGIPTLEAQLYGQQYGVIIGNALVAYNLGTLRWHVMVTTDQIQPHLIVRFAGPVTTVAEVLERWIEAHEYYRSND